MTEIPQWKREHQAWQIENELPEGAIIANLEKQAPNNSYGVKGYYADLPFTCADCRKKDVWTAKDQQWWYEVAKGNINSTAIRCRTCRNNVREEKQRQKQHMEEMARKRDT